MAVQGASTAALAGMKLWAQASLLSYILLSLLDEVATSS